MVATTNRQRGKRGVVLVLALLFLLVLTLIGISIINTATLEVQISGNNRISAEAFYLAEAGINEFTGRFWKGATGVTGESVEISDNDPMNTDWKLFLVTNADRAAKIGYDSGNETHVLVRSIQNQLNYAVEIRHKVDTSNRVVTKANLPVYIVTSHGFTKEEGNKIVEVELHKLPEVDPPAALYSKAPVQMHGSSTYITGMDRCPAGGQSNNKPGIITTTTTISQSGNPTINGDPPEITGSRLNIHLKSIIDDLKDYANFAYQYNRDQTLTGFSDSWGVPQTHGTTEPLEYMGPMNIVYYKMNGQRTLKLAGGCHGAGILLVDGNLEINGGFLWYGVIIVTGTFTFTGGGEKNITGAVLTGEPPTVTTDMGGNASILYCSDAVRKLKDALPSIKITQWREVF